MVSHAGHQNYLIDGKYPLGFTRCLLGVLNSALHRLIHNKLKARFAYPQDIDIHVLHFGKCKQAVGDLLIVEAVYAICP